MKQTLLFALLATTLVAANAGAQETSETSTSTIKASEATKGNDRKNTDEDITNAKLRAQTGSKSKYSFQSALGYSGGSVEEPFAKKRPQLSQGATTDLNTVLSGDISMKYRINDTNNLNVGTGIGLTTPGHSGQKSQVSNPFVSVGNVGKIGSLQSVISATALYFSQESVRERNKVDSNIGADHTIIYSVGATGLDLGLNYGADYTFYQDSNTSEDVKGGATGREDLTIAAYPFMEYAFTDKASFRTVLRATTFIHLRGEDYGHFRQTDPTQSMGIGYAVTRDIYLYPNIQWVWGDIRSDKTNVALSTNINLF